MDILIALIAAHVAGDFVLQTSRDVARKHHPAIMLKHVIVHGILSYFLVGIWSAIWIPLAVVVTHAIIDRYKLRFGEPTVTWFLGDQLAHIASLVAIALIAAHFADDPAWSAAAANILFPCLAVFAGGVLTVRVGSMVVDLVLAPYLAEIKNREGRDKMPGARGFDDGGRTIGYLERTLLFIFLVAGHPAAVGFLVAAKSILRFGEIKDQKNRLETEYIIIGTLASFSFGTIIAYATVLLLNLR